MKNLIAMLVLGVVTMFTVPMVSYATDHASKEKALVIEEDVSPVVNPVSIHLEVITFMAYVKEKVIAGDDIKAAIIVAKSEVCELPKRQRVYRNRYIDGDNDLAFVETHKGSIAKEETGYRTVIWKHRLLASRIHSQDTFLS